MDLKIDLQTTLTLHSSIRTKLVLKGKEIAELLSCDNEFDIKNGNISFRTDEPVELIEKCHKAQFPFKYEYVHVEDENEEEEEGHHMFDLVFTFTDVVRVSIWED